MARTAQPPSAALRQISQLLQPGDEIVATFWGLAGWSMNLWIVTNQFFAVLVIVPFMLSLRHLYDGDLVMCVTVGVLLSASFLTRPVLVIAVTRRRQLLCCRTSRPIQRQTISQAPIKTPGWRTSAAAGSTAGCGTMGPGTNGRTVRAPMSQAHAGMPPTRQLRHPRRARPSVHPRDGRPDLAGLGSYSRQPTVAARGEVLHVLQPHADAARREM